MAKSGFDAARSGLVSISVGTVKETGVNASRGLKVLAKQRKEAKAKATAKAKADKAYKSRLNKIMKRAKKNG